MFTYPQPLPHTISCVAPASCNFSIIIGTAPSFLSPQIVHRYDIVLIQEIRDSTETTIPDFLNIINKYERKSFLLTQAYECIVKVTGLFFLLHTASQLAYCTSVSLAIMAIGYVDTHVHQYMNLIV